MEKGQESKQKRKTPLTTIAISQEYAKKLDEYLNGTGITRKEFVELSVDYFQRTGFDTDKKQIITSLRRGFRWGLLTFAHIKSKKKAISERIP